MNKHSLLFTFIWIVAMSGCGSNNGTTQDADAETQQDADAETQQDADPDEETSRDADSDEESAADADQDEETAVDADPDAEPDADETSPISCPERILEVSCDTPPPDCPDGSFPAVDPDESCWTGRCVDCVDGCQQDEDCQLTQACGCAYHETCIWAETILRFALRSDECIVVSAKAPTACPDGCPTGECPPECEAWCAPDRTECRDGECQGIIEHMCE